MPGYFDVLASDSSGFKQGYNDNSSTVADVLQVITCGPLIGT